MIYLTGDNVSKDKLQRIAKKCKVELWPSFENPYLYQGDFNQIPESLCVLTADLTETRLKTLFQMPIIGVIDSNATLQSICDFIEHNQNATYNDTLGFLPTGPVIYNTDVALFFTKALQERQKFSSFRSESLHLALHEALVNGLIHGNLHLSSTKRQNYCDFQEYEQIVNRRLNTPAFSRKAISITAKWTKSRMKITIRDEGMGYSLSEMLNKQPEIKSKSGRGLRIIATAADSCTIENYGKEITLSFLKEKTSHPDTISPLSVFNQSTTAPKEDLSQGKVLIIEDNQSNQILLAGLLAQMDIKQIEIAENGVQGLNKVLTFEPDLIILDIAMPKMDGYDVLRRLKSVEQTRSIPVLIQTATDSRESRDKTFRAGASDFITKPINPLEFFARVRIHLENRLLVNRLQNRLKQIQSELAIAQKMQMTLLPSSESLYRIQKKYGLNITSYFEPSDRLGGDFWHTIPLTNNRIGIYLCDFSGHGLASALNTFRLHTLLYNAKATAQKPSEFLSALNQQLYTLLQRGQFATFFFGIYDPQQHTFSYTGAATPPAFAYINKKWRKLPVRGLPLGISPEASYIDHTISFQPGDQIFLYSDALTESLSPQNTQLGEDGLLEIIKKDATGFSLQEGLSRIVERFFQFAEPPLQDDLTTVFMEVKK